MCKPPMFIVLEDASPKQSVLTIQDSKIGVSYDIVVTDRRLGEDTGRNVFVDFGSHLVLVKEQMIRTIADFKNRT